MKQAFIGILILIAAAWAIQKGYTDLYLGGKKRPFWKGTEYIQVCKTPYYSSQDCEKQLVTLLDNKTAQIHFSKAVVKDKVTGVIGTLPESELEQYSSRYEFITHAGDKTTSDITCYFAAKQLPNQPRYVFCRSRDSEGQQWDFMPVWAYYPSMEDLNMILDSKLKNE